MTPKHTPGPWEFIDATKVAGMQFAPKCVIKAGDKQVASFSWNDNSPWFPTKDESQANARLIAAAPDLFEALKAINVDICMISASSENSRLVRDAIAKATGGANLKPEATAPIAYVCEADIRALADMPDGTDMSIAPRPFPEYGMRFPLYAHPPKPEATEGGAHEKGIEAAWEAWLMTAGWSITDIKGTFAAGYRAALSKKEGSDG